MNEEQSNQHFLTLCYTFQQTAMFALGKLANPMTNKVEKNLEQAKGTIDILEMLQIKTKGNLSDQESKFLKNILQELRLNYVYEIEQEQKGNDTKA